METILENSDEYYANLIGLAIQIEPNSLPISTFYGTADPTFDDRQTNRMVNEISKYIPEILIKSVEILKNNNGETNLSIRFERTQ